MTRELTLGHRSHSSEWCYKWYRVATFTDTTHITIVNDTDDDTASYDGGDIGAGASYTIQANTAKAIDNSTTHFLDMVLKLKQYLDEAEVPDEDRFLVIPAAGVNRLLGDSNIKLSVPAAYESLIVQGFLTELAGFKVFRSLRGKNCP